ncbi:unnamed protein product [Kuraishia capsulata CBS 1993]|uniref:EF-hand domain-containing protein n=1 Tax=Kuraishia capsulata CBS 1993 TaxID=1382522 RepID=W6MG12_9ASCO|nr:uncharacterized protein KUCA_T00000597001 [Kuraishia capsulata CBS 1993]CDK24631.1 unnamed protein product [Kuraishia capsulata CBS 1993]
MIKFSLITALFLSLAFAHEDPKQVGTDLYESPPEGVSWQSWHMKSEHGIDQHDPESVFKLHDTRNVNSLSGNDILRMYGLMREEVVGKGDGMGSHDRSEGIKEGTKERILSTVMGLIDKNNDGEISFEEWKEFSAAGGELPDMGVGVGHELGFEGEYERHHWLEHHAENDPEVYIQHPEDIEHELLHHEHEVEHEAEHEQEHEGVAQTKTTKSQIILANIPKRFLA